jgi:hypothetical protein
MASDKPPFEFGQTIYVAMANAYGEDLVPCPICHGKLHVTLTLGDGTSTPAQCEFCANGCDGPKGYVMRRGPSSRVIVSTVTGLTKSKYFDDPGWHIEGTGHVSERESAGNVFDNEADAEARRAELHAQAEIAAQRNFESRFKAAKGKTTWTVGYHRSCIEDLERQLEWHRAKLSAKGSE